MHRAIRRVILGLLVGTCGGGGCRSSALEHTPDRRPFPLPLSPISCARSNSAAAQMVRCRLKLRHKTPRAVELRFSGDLTGIMCHKGELLNNLRNVALPVGFHAGRHPQGRSARFSDRLPQSRRNKIPRKWLHGGYMAPKTEKACRSFLKQQAFVFIGGPIEIFAPTRSGTDGTSFGVLRDSNHIDPKP